MTGKKQQKNTSSAQPAKKEHGKEKKTQNIHKIADDDPKAETANPETNNLKDAPQPDKKSAKEEKEEPKDTKTKKAKKEEPKSKEKQAGPIKGEWSILKFPHLSEKSISNIETQNKIVFIVKPCSNRSEIKKAVENMFDVKVEKINMLTTAKGDKKALVKLKPGYSALDIATRLGMM